ncbi:hypothetical protein [Mycolicibacterium austroafricanum]|uniref:hypothetical protein n=1 Tax=Mycolicibacterium austroafricanum TaxID=39687 RepID=UPI001CA35469|nr:hypothetical protein [Mycolicibacterium austroafricanum]QZT64192.1 hypothetical protein JN085_07560 [Mycolicibacterium austroafricanum]
MTAPLSPRPAAAVHIADLARPTFSPEAQAIIDGMAAMADYPGFFAKCCDFRGVDTRKCLSCKE